VVAATFSPFDFPQSVRGAILGTMNATHDRSPETASPAQATISPFTPGFRVRKATICPLDMTFSAFEATLCVDDKTFSRVEKANCARENTLSVTEKVLSGTDKTLAGAKKLGQERTQLCPRQT